MNTVLLRAALRHPIRGTRTWIVPGFGNVAVLRPSSQSLWDAPSFSWPCLDKDGAEVVRTVRLDWHRGIAKAEARKILASVA